MLPKAFRRPTASRFEARAPQNAAIGREVPLGLALALAVLGLLLLGR